ncbi:MAG: NADH-quinone oxidoreductase subunit H [Myxococcota bacterium]|jgi:formate hydrogenlyase subunit 4|nr:NADH-quinone oxidoreductase subunit H [Myxococcota bacterium]
MQALALVHLAVALLAAPLLLSVINKTKAFFGGRQGPPWLQPYRELTKLLHKGVARSRSTSWVFVAGPIVSVAATALALCLVPLGVVPALVAFPGDFVLLAYLLGLARFFTVSAALDTGSAFEGMGASREVQLSALAEPGLLLAFVVLAVATQALSLTGLFARLGTDGGPALVLVFVALLVIFLSENSRIPVDDPNTHLELTMIHEVMILDHSGPDLALIHYAAALKMWLLGTLLIGVPLSPWVSDGFASLLLGVLAMFALAVLVGVIESSTARLRLTRLPQWLLAAFVLTAVALFVVMG